MQEFNLKQWKQETRDKPCYKMIILSYQVLLEKKNEAVIIGILTRIIIIQKVKIIVFFFI